MKDIHPLAPPSTPRRLADRRRFARPTFHLLCGLVIALLLVLVAVALAWPRPLTLTLVFDHVDGLQAGDAVYLEGLRIGRVRALRLTGRRVEVEVGIEARHRHAIPEDAHFFLWQDELDSDRRALRVQPGTW